MHLLKLNRTLNPLHTSTIVSLFAKLQPRLKNICYEQRTLIRPGQGDLYILAGFEDAVSDERVYDGPTERFHEEQFDVVIEKSTSHPPIMRFIYYNHSHGYRLVHYLVYTDDERKSAGEQTERRETYYDLIAEEMREDYLFVKDILFPGKKEEPDELERIDYNFWKKKFTALFEQTVKPLSGGDL
jgi:hypothetical protein